MTDRSQRLKVLNLETSRFLCVYPECGGLCCKNGRPALETAEVRNIQANLEKFLPHLRPKARSTIEKQGFVSRRMKEGKPMLSVAEEYCVFFNEGCVLHKIGAAEGDRSRYKPWKCVMFPLERSPEGEWYVRQWGLKGEGWDVFCLNPKEADESGAETLQYEVEFATELEHGAERWRKKEVPVQRSRASTRGAESPRAVGRRTASRPKPIKRRGR